MASLVVMKVGTYRQVMDMDFEDAIHTYGVFLIDSLNQKWELEKNERNSKRV